MGVRQAVTPCWETASEYKSWKAWAAPFYWTCHIESTPEAGTGPQEGSISFLGPGLHICAELLYSCGAWRRGSFGHVPPSFSFLNVWKWSLLWLKSFPRLDSGSRANRVCMVTVQTIAPVSPEEASVFALEHLPQHPGVGTWCCGGDEACKRAWPVQGGRHKQRLGNCLQWLYFCQPKV